MALLGATGLWMPRIGFAQDAPRLAARFVPRVSAAGLTIELFVRNRERAGLELLANAMHLVVEVPGKPEPLTLASDHRQGMRMTRSGFRIGRHFVLASGEERSYDSYSAVWPRGVERSRRMELMVRAALDYRRESRPAGERPGLTALGRLAARVTIGA